MSDEQFNATFVQRSADFMKHGKNPIKQEGAWRQVEAPRAWHPIDHGEELVGVYGGRIVRGDGQNGSSYDIALIHTPHDGSFSVTGVRIIGLLDAAMIQRGEPIRVVWRGWSGAVGNSMKQFDLFVAADGAEGVKAAGRRQ